MTLSSETIYALSTGAGTTAVAVIRASGPGARFGLETLAGACPLPRRASLRRLVHDGRPLDRALVIWFPAPASFTGEDMVEYQVHGGRAVISAVLGALAALGHRPAEPGEFTRRAFANGRLDMTEVEGLSDLLAAETEWQRRQALAQSEGVLGRIAAGWRADLIHAMALVESQLDFADEGDVVSDPVMAEARALVARLRTDVAQALASSHVGERLRDGLSVVIAGPPNAGKSTLLNALARRDVAIVTPIPGTTRDLIEVRLDLAGIPVTLVDTAGLRETTDLVEGEGIRRTLARAEGADLVLWLTEDGSDPAALDGARPVWSIQTKIDSSPVRSATAHLALSVRSGDGFGILLDRLTRWASQTLVGADNALVTRERHRLALEGAREALDRVAAGLHPDRLELVAEDLRLAIRALDTLIGRVDVEAVLDDLFAGFCIGK